MCIRDSINAEYMGIQQRMSFMFKCCLTGKQSERDSSIELCRENEKKPRTKTNQKVLEQNTNSEMHQSDTLMLTSFVNKNISSPTSFHPCKGKKVQKHSSSAKEEAKLPSKGSTRGAPELVLNEPYKKLNIVVSRLVLEVIEANTVEHGYKYIIEPKSMVAGSEPVIQEKNYFGGPSTQTESFGKPLDFIFPQEENFSPLQFCVQFSAVQNCFSLKDLNSPSTFVNLGKCFVLWPSTLISLGNPNIQAKILVHNSDTPEAFSELNLTIFRDNIQIHSYKFTQRDSPIWIGRTEHCKVRIKSEGLSRVQAKIEFRHGVWLLMDGDGLKHSTNGTWVCPDQYFPLSTHSIFRSGGVIFRCSVQSIERNQHSRVQFLQTMFQIYLNISQSLRLRKYFCLLYTSPSPRDLSTSRMPSSA
eukprot:TRINITY_DN4029_c0_g2_i1.p1 TRINITY_DN4029_c0_g2~~TRINITY_DN4029_c0_g2_i1.p1  ORF type:complete len:427 (+),score=27.67 TRINITY_DN4029_c0_g2_i1:39-1283(+)